MGFSGCDPEQMRAAASKMDAAMEQMNDISNVIIREAAQLEWQGEDHAAFMRQASSVGRIARRGLLMQLSNGGSSLRRNADSQDNVSASLKPELSSAAVDQPDGGSRVSQILAGGGVEDSPIGWTHGQLGGLDRGFQISAVYDPVNAGVSAINAGKWVLPGIATARRAIDDYAHAIPLDSSKQAFRDFSDQLMRGEVLPLNPGTNTPLYPHMGRFLSAADKAGTALDWISLAKDGYGLGALAEDGGLFSGNGTLLTDAGWRTGIDVAWDTASIAYPPVGAIKGTWDLSTLAGRSLANFMEDRFDVSGNFVNATLLRINGTTDLSGAQATQLAQRYDGVSGFGTYVSDNLANTGSSLVHGAESVASRLNPFD